MINNFWNEKEKELAHRAVQKDLRPQLPELVTCALCLRKIPKDMIVGHHFLGYAEENWLNVWWICNSANSMIYEHDGTELEWIRKIYKVTPDMQLGFLKQDCGMKEKLRKRRLRLCKWFLEWQKFICLPRSYHIYRELFLQNVDRKEGPTEYIKARLALMDVTEDQIWEPDFYFGKKGE